jgi:hypothetical protein
VPFAFLVVEEKFLMQTEHSAIPDYLHLSWHLTEACLLLLILMEVEAVLLELDFSLIQPFYVVDFGVLDYWV